MNLVKINGVFFDGKPFETVIVEEDSSQEMLDAIVAGTTSDGAMVDASSITTETIEIPDPVGLV